MQRRAIALGRELRMIEPFAIGVAEPALQLGEARDLALGSLAQRIGQLLPALRAAQELGERGERLRVLAEVALDPAPGIDRLGQVAELRVVDAREVHEVGAPLLRGSLGFHARLEQLAQPGVVARDLRRTDQRVERLQVVAIAADARAPRVLGTRAITDLLSQARGLAQQGALERFIGLEVAELTEHLERACGHARALEQRDQLVARLQHHVLAWSAIEHAAQQLDGRFSSPCSSHAMPARRRRSAATAASLVASAAAANASISTTGSRVPRPARSASRARAAADRAPRASPDGPARARRRRASSSARTARAAARAVPRPARPSASSSTRTRSCGLSSSSRRLRRIDSASLRAAGLAPLAATMRSSSWCAGPCVGAPARTCLICSSAASCSSSRSICSVAIRTRLARDLVGLHAQARHPERGKIGEAILPLEQALERRHDAGVVRLERVELLQVAIARSGSCAKSLAIWAASSSSFIRRDVSSAVSIALS